MLLGYILEVVKSRQVAEQYLVDIFGELQPLDIEHVTQTGVNTFCRLQQIARKKLATFTQNIDDCAEDNQRQKSIAISDNRFTNLMSPDEQLVFCAIHYHGKSTASLAIELNKPETAIRQILRDSFIKIRNNRDTATIHQ